MNVEMPLIIAHRGASAAAPENTLAAFRRAIECGSDGIEFDVRLAADGVPVVIHDATLERTGGRLERLSDLSSAELSQVDAGSWFNRKRPELADPEFENQAVPTLRETLELLSSFGGRIYIELKSEEPDILPLCRSVAGLIDDSPQKPQIVVKSFRLAAIPAMRTLCPDVRTAALFEPNIKTILRKKRYLTNIAREVGADELSIHHSLATRRLATAAHETGLSIVIWTVDDTRWIRKSADLGVYALITNDPERMMHEREALRIKT